MTAWEVGERRRLNLESFRMMTELWPEPKKPKRLPTEVVLEETEWLLEGGVPGWEVAQILNVNQLSLSRLAYRHGRPDLGRRLDELAA